MNRQKEWNLFLESLQTSAQEEYRRTTEYAYIQKQRDEIDMIFRDNLTVDEKEMVEECLFEIGMTSDRQAEILYHQGMKDCIWLLKSLGVLA